MNPWASIVGAVPTTVLAIVSDMAPVLGLLVGLGVASAVVGIVVSVFRGVE